MVVVRYLSPLGTSFSCIGWQLRSQPVHGLSCVSTFHFLHYVHTRHTTRKRERERVDERAKRRQGKCGSQETTKLCGGCAYLLFRLLPLDGAFEVVQRQRHLTQRCGLAAAAKASPYLLHRRVVPAL
jgi:hypothetical protein